MCQNCKIRHKISFISSIFDAKLLTLGMNWSKNLSAIEYTFIIAFALIYGIYIFRVMFLARKMGVSSRAIFLKLFLRTTYFSLLIVVLLGPVFGDSTRILQANGRDLLVAVDVSKSMDVDDVQPSRLEKAKFELLKIVENLQADRLGIVIFTTDAFVHLPLTFDKEAQKIFIQSLNTELISESGTDLNAVLELTLKKMADGQIKNKAKGLILITDGEDLGEVNSDLLKKMRFNQIKTIVVGIGTRAGGKIMEGGEALRSEDGTDVVSKLNTKALRELSTNLLGEYIEVSQYKTDFSAVLEAINRIENSVVDRRNFFVSANKYQYFLILALILLALDILWIVKTMKL